MSRQRRLSYVSKGNFTAAVYKDFETGEFVVKFSENGKRMPESDYFTDDLDDAITTSCQMVDHASKK